MVSSTEAQIMKGGTAGAAGFDFGAWRWLSSGAGVVALLAAAKLALHLATATVYGPFIDELYFLASGEHLAFGYVDFPPLVALQAWVAKGLFGDWVVGIRLLPALAGAGTVLLTGALVRELGGKRFAQGLAAFAVGFSPGLLAFDSYLSMNSIEPLLWMGCALVLMRLVRTGNTRLWLPFGVHLSYWLWGPRGYTGETAIILGDRNAEDGALQWFESVEEVAEVGHVYAMQQEHFTVLLCRRPKGRTLAEVWPQLKKYE